MFFDSEIREDVGSVVGIVQVAGDVDKAGMMVRYVAIISLVLAVMNLLPLLELDGYWMLSDALRVRDLRARSLAFVRREGETRDD